MPYTTNVAGTTITAAWGNANVRDQVVTPFASASARNSAITSPVEGMIANLNDNNLLTIYTGAAWENLIYPAYGASVTWTPTVTQSATPTLTNTYSAYSRYGRHIDFNAVVTVASGTGTASNDVVVSLPVQMAYVTNTVIGTGMIQDVSASLQYPGFLVAVSATTAKLAPADAGSTLNGYFGASVFTAALATGDFIKYSGAYEGIA